LVLDSLIECAYPAIENRGHSECARKASVHLGTCPQRHPLRLRSRLPRHFLRPLGYAPAGMPRRCAYVHNASRLIRIEPVSLARLSTFTPLPLRADQDRPKQRLLDLIGKRRKEKI
jgi:hypothetical protein